jgi:RimJ/RimL family protein N-acetyltransferase
MVDFYFPDKLPDDVLVKREQLPLKPAPVTLQGRYVYLRPLDLARDAEGLFAVQNGQAITIGDYSTEAYDAEKLIWLYLAGGNFESPAALAFYLQPQVDAADGLAMCVLDAKTGHPLGVTTFMSNVPAHLKIELGNIWYGRVAQGTKVNTEAIYLMLKHTFALGYRRLEWKCNALNERSRRVALKLGFQFEGVQDAHYIIKGRNRDTAWFRMLDHEWEGVKGALEARLYD